MKTKQDQLLDRRPDLVRGSGLQRSVKLGRRIGYAKQITSHLALRRQDHQPARMRILSGGRIVGVLETDLIREWFDGGCLARQEMPALGRARAAITFEV